MDEKCRDCVYITEVQKDVGELKTKIDKIDNRLQVVEKTDGMREIQMNNFSVTLNEIKSSIDKLNTTIMNIKLQPAKDAHFIKNQVWIYILCTVIGFILANLPKIL